MVTCTCLTSSYCKKHTCIPKGKPVSDHDLSGMSRDMILAMLKLAWEERDRERKQVVKMFDNLTSTQARCTELLEENRELKKRVAEYDDFLAEDQEAAAWVANGGLEKARSS